MCAIDFADQADFAHGEWRRAGKVHRCEECIRVIPRGQRHYYLSTLFDGRWSTWRTCEHCHAAGLWMHVVCGGYLTGGLLEELVEHWDEGFRSVGFGRLIVGMRRRWNEGRDAVPEGVAELANAMLREQVAA